MKTHVEFRSDAFPAYPDESEDVNPGLWGKRLAEYLASALASRGIRTGDIYPEDWGWAVPVQNDRFTMWVGCSNYQEYPDGFLAFVEPSKPTITKFLFQKIDTTEDVSRVSEAIDDSLTSHPRVSDLRWLTDDEH